MNKRPSQIFFKLIGIVVIMMFASCLNDKVEEQKDSERQLINEYIKDKGFTEIAFESYLKFYNRDNIDILENNVETGNSFVMNYDGTYIDGILWETTDSAKGAEEFPGRYSIYGPAKLRAGQLSMLGLDTALKYFSPGDTGTVVIPSWYAWGNNQTMVFHIGMKEVIKNDSIYEYNQFNDFFDANNFNPGREIYSGVYWKSPVDTLNLSDTSLYSVPASFRIKLTGRYAENYYSNGLGRIFYPILDDSTEFNIVVGENNFFPIIPAIDSTLLKMKAGDIVEIFGSSGIGWREIGYYHPQLGINIIPQYMPLHYSIELDSVFQDVEE